MRKLYEKNEVLFAGLWILVYCLVLAPIRSYFGDESIWMVLALLIMAVCITAFVKVNHLEKKYGLTGWPQDTGKYLYFIPMWIIAVGNMWDGFSLSYNGMSLVYAVLTMLLVGYVEEMLFRGFLFKALIPKDGIVTAVIISSVTFGIGHIVNLFTGQANLETIIQIIFAISWGFVLTMVFYKSGSLFPCIIAHMLVDVSSLFGADTKSGDWIYVGVTIVVAVAYSVYLYGIKNSECENEN